MKRKVTKNPKASKFKIRWNRSVEVLNEIENSYSKFKEHIKTVIDKNLSKQDYESEFIISVNKYLTKIAKSGQVTEFSGCKYVFDRIKYIRKFHSNECECMKMGFNKENRNYNCRF